MTEKLPERVLVWEDFPDQLRALSFPDDVALDGYEGVIYIPEQYLARAVAKARKETLTEAVIMAVDNGHMPLAGLFKAMLDDEARAGAAGEGK